ncbi:MAG: uracil phosphoribosyltransferase [Planctomycetes bacterium]|nr:uracil phosphoribosyltransferase [Planctomycetota bacterium]MCB9869744.1 uracil phosphoribosyltransferase [Planctomycetota bacterium]
MALEHQYGPHVHLSDNLWLRSLLVRIGAPDTPLRDIAELVRAAYRFLAADVLGAEFPRTDVRAPTRMLASEPRGVYTGPALCPETPLVVAGIVRGGILPAQVCYEAACQVLPPENVRLDFLTMSRTLDGDGRVTGVRTEGSKIGGSAAGAVVLIPDPMGATGGTIARTIEIYNAMEGAPPARFVAAHLMVTPEALQRLTAGYPELRIHAGRFDRGLSAAEVLDTLPGAFPERERGLTEHQYIVPGAGGIGEILTNSWV